MERFKKILYVRESRVATKSSLERAVSLAQNNQAQLTVVDVVRDVAAGLSLPPDMEVPVDLTEAVVAKHRRELESMVAPYREGLVIDTDVVVGIEFLEVIRKVLRESYDLVIKSAEDPGWLDRLFGSEDMHLLRKCPCPVWLMKPNDSPNYRRIVAAVDFDPGVHEPEEEALNHLILQLASSLALSDFAELHLVHVWDAPEAELISLWSDAAGAAEVQMIEAVRANHDAGMRQLTHRLKKQIGQAAYDYLSPKVHLNKGLAGQEIPALVERIEADIVVMGTVGRTGIPGLFIGNTAETVLYELQSSVLAVKPPGFISPVSLK